MAVKVGDWHVQESDTEENFEENKPERPYSIDSTKLLEMLKLLKTGQVLEMSCEKILNLRRVEERQNRKRERGDNSCEEETSETTSEIRSTHTASTSECRDSRRPSLTAFDYEEEDFSVKTTTTIKTKKCLLGLKRRMIALDEIEASLRKEDDIRWKSHQVENELNISTVNAGIESVDHLEDSDAGSSIFDADISFQSQDITSQINQIELLLQEECQ